jgi:hypothetical protein
MKKNSKVMYGTSKVKVSQKKWPNEWQEKNEWMKERKKERKEGEIWEREKNIYEYA